MQQHEQKTLLVDEQKPPKSRLGFRFAKTALDSTKSIYMRLYNFTGVRITPLEVNL